MSETTTDPRVIALNITIAHLRTQVRCGDESPETAALLRDAILDRHHLVTTGEPRLTGPAVDRTLVLTPAGLAALGATP